MNCFNISNDNISSRSICNWHGNCHTTTRRNDKEPQQQIRPFDIIDGIEYYCHCDNLYDFKSNCSRTFFEVWGNWRFLFPSLQFFLVLPVAVILALELWVDIKHYKKKKNPLWKSNNFITKCLLSLVVVLRIIFTAEDLWRNAAMEPVKLMTFETVVWNLSLASCILIVNYVMISWIDIVTRIKGMSKAHTKHFVIATRIIYAGICIFVFPFFILALLLAAEVIGTSVWHTGLAVILGYVLCLIIWSFYHIFQLRAIFSRASKLSQQMSDTKRKNVILAVANFGLVGNIIITSLYIGLDAIHYAWVYMILLGLSVTFQHLVVICYLLIVEKRLTRSPWLKAYFQNEVEQVEASSTTTTSAKMNKPSASSVTSSTPTTNLSYASY